MTSATMEVDKEWLDGPAVVKWLESVGKVTGAEIGDAGKRRMFAWRHGETCSVYTLDRLMTKVGLHISMLPDEMFLDHNPSERKARAYQRRRRPVPSPAVREEIIGLYCAGGVSFSQLAADFNLDRRQISRWVAKAREQD